MRDYGCIQFNSDGLDVSITKHDYYHTFERDSAGNAKPVQSRFYSTRTTNKKGLGDQYSYETFLSKFTNDTKAVKKRIEAVRKLKGTAEGQCFAFNLK